MFLRKKQTTKAAVRRYKIVNYSTQQILQFKGLSVKRYNIVSISSCDKNKIIVEVTQEEANEIASYLNNLYQDNSWIATCLDEPSLFSELEET